MSSGPDSRHLKRLGDYVIHRVIGEGGMGIVYEATEHPGGGRVALKVLHSSLAHNEGARERFFGEMRILAGIQHPNIVRSLSSAQIDGKLVMVLEYLEGRTLREELVLQGALPVSRAITVASAVASALGAAHGASPRVVHRDLKPENVMLAADGRIKVMDFGIAKVLDHGNRTNTSQAVGTVKYMSPEQASGGVMSPQTDLYALGLLLYEMLAGKAPFESASLLALLRHHCETPAPPLPDQVRREVPLALEQLTLHLLEKEPRARPDGALAVLNALIALNGAAPQGEHAAQALPAITADVATPPGIVRAAALSAPDQRSSEWVNERPAPAPSPSPNEWVNERTNERTNERPNERPNARPNERPNGRRDDTIDLILRLEPKKRRGTYVIGFFGFVAIAGLIAGGVVYASSSRSERRSKDGQVAAAPAASGGTGDQPGASPSIACRPQDICVPFTSANPKAVASEAIIAESSRLALQLDPRAVFIGASFDAAVVDGFVDTTRTFARISCSYALPDASISVSLGTTGFTASKSPYLANGEPFAGSACPLKRAWDAAFMGKEPPDPRAWARLHYDARPRYLGGKWTVVTGKKIMSVDAATCVLRK
jgi:serine/threonine protein kinase